MSPRLEIDLNKIQFNARSLIGLLATRGISVTGVTKATLGSPEIARTLVSAGIESLGDSRIENIERLREAKVPATMKLIRSPMVSQVSRVVEHADVSFNTELEIIKHLSINAQKLNRIHEIILMIELGDLREGIMPGSLEKVVLKTLEFPNISIRGLGTNLSCQNGVFPDGKKMSELSFLTEMIESKFGLKLQVVSGGNSANLDWALSEDNTGRINNLRLGESILLGRDTRHSRPLKNLHHDAFTLVAEVIESASKPSQPWGTITQTLDDEQSDSTPQFGQPQILLAIGQQDFDLLGLFPQAGIEILGASSDHLIVNSEKGNLPIGSEVEFQLNYPALMRAMTSPFIAKCFKGMT